MSSATPLANFISLTEPFGPPSPLAPLSETRMTSVLSRWLGLLQVVEQPPDVVVGVREEAGVDLRHPREQALLVVAERVPGPGVVELGERLAVGAGPGLRRADRVERREPGVGRDDPHVLLPGQGLLADRLVAHVELAPEPVDPLARGVVRRVARPGGVVEEVRLVRRHRLGVLDELERLVGDVVGQVIALFRGARRVHRVVVVDQVRVPLVGLGAEEAVEPLGSPAARPVAAGRREVHLVRRAQVPLADQVGVPAAFGQDLREHAVLGRDRAAGVGEADGGLGDAGHAVARVVAAGEQARAGGRAQRGGVPLGVAHSLRGDPVDIRRRDRPAVAAHGREAHVVKHDVHDIGRVLRRLGRLERRPVGFRVADVDVDGPLERLRH